LRTRRCLTVVAVSPPGEIHLVVYVRATIAPAFIVPFIVRVRARRALVLGGFLQPRKYVAVLR
jgi:hypothetical protein